jgi:hypothetical protein
LKSFQRLLIRLRARKDLRKRKEADFAQFTKS